MICMESETEHLSPDKEISVTVSIHYLAYTNC